MVQRWYQTSLKLLAAGLLASGLTVGQAVAFDWRENFIDSEDGKFDVSNFLSSGGFIPVPIIITEPAVDGGFGFAGQFLHPPSAPGGAPGRTIIGGVYTGNDSYGGGFMRSGGLAEGALSYKIGLGAGDVTMPIFPFGGDKSIDYENFNAGGFATIRYNLPDTAFSFGPRAIYRTTDVSLKADGPLEDRVNQILGRFSNERTYAALGMSLNYDTRNNPITPTKGVNAIVKYDFYREALSSETNFDAAQLTIHSFTEFNNKAWSLGGLLDLQGVTDDAPFFMSPGVSLRGVQHGRYQGDGALSLETELRHQFTPRWAGVVFGGYGETYVNNSKLYDAEAGIWTYGAGVRYRIARKHGIDVGLDVARGPDQTVFYIQFGHAWARTMD